MAGPTGAPLQVAEGATVSAREVAARVEALEATVASQAQVRPMLMTTMMAVDMCIS